MPGRFTDLEVRDPHLIASTAWNYLPPWEKAVLDRPGFISSREWAPLDQRRFRIEPESYRTQYSIANIGTLRAHRIADRALGVLQLAANGLHMAEEGWQLAKTGERQIGKLHQVFALGLDGGERKPRRGRH